MLGNRNHIYKKQISPFITRCRRIQDGDGWDEPDAETGPVKAIDDSPHVPPVSRPVAGISIRILETLEINDMIYLYFQRKKNKAEDPRIC